MAMRKPAFLSFPELEGQSAGTVPIFGVRKNHDFLQSVPQTEPLNQEIVQTER